jgi:hypothetical protein
MRKIIIALSTVAFAAGIAGIEAQAAKAPAKTKLGCVVGKEKWDAAAGKCGAVAKAPVKKAAKKA